jgi:GTP cyclohydrolase II
MEGKIQLTREVCARVPTGYGEFQLCLYTNNLDKKEHLALVRGDVYEKENILVRIHSECFTGDVLGSRRCDCGEQLHSAMEMIAQECCGVVVYLRQEGRGIGLLEKLHAYNLQDGGYDTYDANLALGHLADERDYGMAAAILKELGVRSVRLMTNNPGKIADLESYGIPVLERIALVPTVFPDNEAYLLTKVQRMQHLIELDADQPNAMDVKDGDL